MADILQKILQLEEHKGFQDTAMSGGLGTYAGRWAELARGLGSAELLPSEARRVLQDEREGWREVAFKTATTGVRPSSASFRVWPAH